MDAVRWDSRYAEGRVAKYHVRAPTIDSKSALTQSMGITQAEKPMHTQTIVMATTLMRGAMLPVSRQFRRVGPTNRWLSNHCSRRGLLRSKDQSAMRKKTVEGNPGMNRLTAPTPTHNRPRPM